MYKTKFIEIQKKHRKLYNKNHNTNGFLKESASAFLVEMGQSRQKSLLGKGEMHSKCIEIHIV